MQNVIEIKNLWFKYDNEPVLENVNLVVEKGDFLGIVGSNGTGKSTLIRLVLGQIAPTSGSILLMGQDATQFKKWPEIGYVPQNCIALAGNFPATTEEIVLANLYSKIGPLKLPNKKHKAMALSALAQVGMQAYAKCLMGNLSGGQQQRVMIAKALACNPAVLLLDEPVNGVDAESAESLYALLSKLNKENAITIVMISHDIEKISRVTDRLLLLKHNTLVEISKTELKREMVFAF